MFCLNVYLYYVGSVPKEARWSIGSPKSGVKQLVVGTGTELRFSVRVAGVVNL